MTLRALLQSHEFRVGLLIKLGFVLLVLPHTQNEWFVPFVSAAVAHPGLDPWTAFRAAGGSAMAFPYGPVMLLVHLPLAILARLGDVHLGLGLAPTFLAFRLTQLVGDIFALVALVRLLPTRRTAVVVAFWLSPLSLYITYWHGQTDIVPVALMLWAFVFLGRKDVGRAGIALAAAVSAKLSMALTVPFILIYLAQNRRLRVLLPRFVVASAAAIAVLLAPWALFSTGFRVIVLGTPEILKVYRLVVQVSDAQRIYVVPLTYVLMLYATWRLRRSNMALLLAMTGVSFLVVVLATPASPGWYLWTLPFLVLYQVEADRAGVLSVTVFSMSVVAILLLVSSGASVPLLALDLAGRHSGRVSAHYSALWNTGVVCLGVILIFRMYRQGVQQNDYYRLSRRALAIGISGDSGAGKDTLARGLSGLFGSRSVSYLCGDAYHKWDRGAPMWRSVTHLNPRANDLQRFSQDSCSVIDGNTVMCRHYDHASGRFTHPVAVRGNDVVIVSGLHTFLPSALCEKLDVKVYLDPEEDLRQHWKLTRDSQSRGQGIMALLETMELRRPDKDAFVRPQAAKADIVFTLCAVNPEHLRRAVPPEPLPLKLRVVLREGLHYELLVRALIGICGLQVDWDLADEGRGVEMTVTGEVAAEDIQLAARGLAHHLDELLAVDCRWDGDMLGVMQLVMLAQIDHTLKKRGYLHES